MPKKKIIPLLTFFLALATSIPVMAEKPNVHGNIIYDFAVSDHYFIKAGKYLYECDEEIIRGDCFQDKYTNQILLGNYYYYKNSSAYRTVSQKDVELNKHNYSSTNTKVATIRTVFNKNLQKYENSIQINGVGDTIIKDIVTVPVKNTKKSNNFKTAGKQTTKEKTTKEKKVKICRIHVDEYECPCKSFKLDGKEYVKSFRKTPAIGLKWKSGKSKKIKFQVKPAKNWKLKWMAAEYDGNWITVKRFKNGQKIKLTINKSDKKKYTRVEAVFYNSKTKKWSVLYVYPGKVPIHKYSIPF